MERFDRDIAEVVDRLIASNGKEVEESLLAVRSKLRSLYEQGLVKINHSILEVIAACYIARNGYAVDVEHRVDDALVCDVYGTKGGGCIIVEIETGFVPPEHAVNPERYLLARVVSKIARYSRYADKFCISTPNRNLLEIPDVYLKPPKQRSIEEILAVKRLCDEYYSNPPISIDEIRNARLHAVYIISVDRLSVNELDPVSYAELIHNMLM